MSKKSRTEQDGMRFLTGIWARDTVRYEMAARIEELLRGVAESQANMPALREFVHRRCESSLVAEAERGGALRAIPETEFPGGATGVPAIVMALISRLERRAAEFCAGVLPSAPLVLANLRRMLAYSGLWDVAHLAMLPGHEPSVGAAMGRLLTGPFSYTAVFHAERRTQEFREGLATAAGVPPDFGKGNDLPDPVANFRMVAQGALFVAIKTIPDAVGLFEVHDYIRNALRAAVERDATGGRTLDQRRERQLRIGYVPGSGHAPNMDESGTEISGDEIGTYTAEDDAFSDAAALSGGEREQLVWVVSRLPPENARLIALVMSGYNLGEAASKMGITYDAARQRFSRLVRAIGRLK